MEMIKNAIENIKTNKLKVIVAMVWIVLGITSVVVVSSIGNGIEQQGEKTGNNPEFRTNIITFSPNYESTFDPEFYESFTQEDLGKAAAVKGVEKITPKDGDDTGINLGKSVMIDGQYQYTEISEYKKNQKLDIEFGRNFTLDDLDRNTIIINNQLAYKVGIFTERNALGKSIDIDGETFEVIGVLKSTNKGNMITDGFEEPKSYMPKKALKDLNDRSSFGGTLNGIEVLAKVGYEPSEVSNDVLDKIQEGKAKDLGEYSITGGGSGDHQLRILQQTINRFTAILSKVSLAIGGIGIMNIMYMSVSERKREIGIRRAIGAEQKDIVIQFLIETIVITIMGGLVGIVVGTIAASQVGPYLGVPAIPSAKVYIDALLVSIITGAIFGAIPAIKAAKLDPIQAIQG